MLVNEKKIIRPAFSKKDSKLNITDTVNVSKNDPLFVKIPFPIKAGKQPSSERTEPVKIMETQNVFKKSKELPHHSSKVLIKIDSRTIIKNKQSETKTFYGHIKYDLSKKDNGKSTIKEQNERISQDETMQVVLFKFIY